MFFGFSLSASFGAANDRPTARGRSLAIEPLESRVVLSAAGLVDVGAQPEGALSGKIVYTHGGHGYTANDSGGWGYQRPLLLDMVEDLGNQDQMTAFVDALWDAGATIVPLRPVGHQTNEVVLDNDDAGVTFHGDWSDGSGSIYYGSLGDVRYGTIATSTVETATAVYRPDLPEAGTYPVYAWSPAGTNRATDQLYRVHHSGGATEVTVDHSRVGNGLVYLGSYHFEEGTEGYVEISNRSDDAGAVVVADMIRFGNGMGDISRGSGVSGQPRENEAGLYWVEWHVDRSQGIPTSAYRTSSSDRTATVSLSPRYSAFMNQGSVGDLTDRVFVSFHSNAGGGNARGVLGLLNGNNRASAATPNQLLLARSLAQEINDDLVAQEGVFEHDWDDNGTSVTLDRTDIEFGEINNEVIFNEFDATIIETGYHDNLFDAQMLLDPRVRQSIAIATVQGLIDYFGDVDGGATIDVDPPGAVADLRVETGAAGTATLHWTPPTSNNAIGSPATGYVVYASVNGKGFDGGTVVSGGSSDSITLNGLDPDETYYFKVVATNAGGQSPDSEVVAASPSGASDKLLIVNGFDRLGRTQVPGYDFPGGGTVYRARQELANSYDYATQVASAIEWSGADVAIDTAANEAIIAGDIDLDDYAAVVWILGEESSADETFDAAEQAAVTQYLAQGGKLFVSGAEIGWDLDNLNNGRTFYTDVLRADYVADDAGAYSVDGVAGSIFEGMLLTFDDGSETYDVNFPDVINPLGGATLALNYGNGSGGAGVQYSGGSGEQVVMLGFPFETIVGEENRNEAMARVLEFFGFTTNTPETISLILDNDDLAPVYVESEPWSELSGGAGGGTQRFVFVGNEKSATWSTELPFSGDVEVFVRYDADTNRATGVNYSVTVGGQTVEAIVNQRLNDFTWVSLGQFSDVSGAATVTIDAGASTGANFNLVIADQIRIDLRGQSPTREGDFNGDGIVNGADYTVWRDTLDTQVTPFTGADADGSGAVDAADRLVWVTNYGRTLANAVATVSTQVEALPAEAEATPATVVDRRFLVAPLTEETPISSPSTGGRSAFRAVTRAESFDRALLLLDQNADRSESASEAVSTSPNEEQANTESVYGPLDEAIVAAF